MDNNSLSDVLFHTQLPLSSEHAMAIGYVTAHWTKIEKDLEHLVWELIGVRQPNSQAITAHLNFDQLINMANSLANVRVSDQSLREQLKAHLKYIGDKPRRKRNSVVHGLWLPTTDAHKVCLAETTARGEVKFKVGEEMSAKDILQFAAEIDQASWSLVNLTFAIASHLGQVSKIHLGDDSDEVTGLELG